MSLDLETGIVPTHSNYSITVYNFFFFLKKNIQFYLKGLNPNFKGNSNPNMRKELKIIQYYIICYKLYNIINI